MLYRTHQLVVESRGGKPRFILWGKDLLKLFLLYRILKMLSFNLLEVNIQCG
jgi:hypothetical protein